MIQLFCFGIDPVVPIWSCVEELRTTY